MPARKRPVAPDASSSTTQRPKDSGTSSGNQSIAPALQMEPQQQGSDTPFLDGVESGGQEQQQAPEEPTHTVARGENLTLIARRHGVSVKDIVQHNGLRNANALSVGQVLKIPSARTRLADETIPGDDIYFVRRGDTLARIAEQFETTVAELAKLNGITNVNYIDIGQPLRIPGRQAPQPEQSSGGGQGSAGGEQASSSGGASTGSGSSGGSQQADMVYTVQRGDLLSRIAQRFGVTTQALQQANGIRNPNQIAVGQKLTIPGVPAVEQAPAEESTVSQEVAEATDLDAGQVDTSQIQNSPALQAAIDAVIRVAPRHDYARDAIPGILRQAAASGVRNANQVAYILATADHESDFGKPMFRRSESLVEDSNGFSQRGGQWSSTNHVNGRRVTAGSRDELEERYWDSAYGGRLGNRRGTSDAADFRGRGYVQLTGRVNYEKMTKKLTDAGFTYELDGVVWGRDQPIDLVANPTHVNRNKELAARCLVDGMMAGSFTGSSLGQHVNDRKTDFYNARGVVNGDKRKNGRAIERIANRYAGALGGWSNVFRGQV